MKEMSLDDMKESFNAGKMSDSLSEPVVSTSVKPRIDSMGRAYATGRRKSAVAKVWLQVGNGKIIVNNKDMESYFPLMRLKDIVRLPFKVAGRDVNYNVVATVLGGGISAQASALRHGISIALSHIEPELRFVLKSASFLTRDSRKVERKKFGHKKARRSFQFSKR